jgi:hypothetical protein
VSAPADVSSWAQKTRLAFVNGADRVSAPADVPRTVKLTVVIPKKKTYLKVTNPNPIYHDMSYVYTLVW